ncbi:MAG: hypothetical protein EZS28_022749 [Streblomastix strix]|uniref:USP domain-containing protein n=1 Tax=Streblomastix strix TaxID=222440 RepID=A0A5J4VGW8_9EUKA|nr:MAG: hypothetical protein EZS28_022749 [Streblomastix strix]
MIMKNKVDTFIDYPIEGLDLRKYEKCGKDQRREMLQIIREKYSGIVFPDNIELLDSEEEDEEDIEDNEEEEDDKKDEDQEQTEKNCTENQIDNKTTSTSSSSSEQEYKIHSQSHLLNPHLPIPLLENEDFPAIYDLYAIVCHSGSMNGGHYIAHALNPIEEDFELKQSKDQEKENSQIQDNNPNCQFKWYTFNDSSVYKCNFIDNTNTQNDKKEKEKEKDVKQIELDQKPEKLNLMESTLQQQQQQQQQQQHQQLYYQQIYPISEPQSQSQIPQQSSSSSRTIPPPQNLNVFKSGSMVSNNAYILFYLRRGTPFGIDIIKKAIKIGEKIERKEILI